MELDTGEVITVVGELVEISIVLWFVSIKVESELVFIRVVSEFVVLDLVRIEEIGVVSGIGYYWSFWNCSNWNGFWNCISVFLGF